MSKLSESLSVEIDLYANLEGAQELIDAHLDEVAGGDGFTLHWNFQKTS